MKIDAEFDQVKYREYPFGTDFVWFALDRLGNIGAFITGGEGPVPLMALDVTLTSVTALEAIACDHAVQSDIEMVVTEDFNLESYLDLAKRGFFVFDWSDTIRPTTHTYNLIVRPQNPREISSLCSELKSQVEEIILDSNFSKIDTIDLTNSAMDFVWPNQRVTTGVVFGQK